MEQKLLAAIVGAVAAYIQQEESATNALRSEVNYWRLSGWGAHMNARVNVRQIVPQSGKGIWWYFGLEKSMADRVRWKIGKYGK